MIYIPDTDEAWFFPTRDATVWACQQCGHDVTMFTHRGQLGPASHIMLWGSNVDEPLLQLCQSYGAKVIYLESGWLLDRRTKCSIQLDVAGVNARASWRDDPLDFEPEGELRMNERSRLLVILRYDTGGVKPDGMEVASPYFKTNLDWAKHLVLTTRMPVCLRPHYLTEEKFNRPLRDLARHQGWEWDDTGDDFVTAASKSKAVAVLDSTAGAQALELGLPVLCFGRQVFRKESVVYCLTNDYRRTATAMAEIVNDRCSLDIGAIGAMLGKIRARQWYPETKHIWPNRMRREFGL